jgi:hypothetical protein
MMWVSKGIEPSWRGPQPKLEHRHGHPQRHRQDRPRRDLRRHQPGKPPAVPKPTEVSRPTKIESWYRSQFFRGMVLDPKGQMQFDRLKRREFIFQLGAAVAAPSPASAE